jgi:hypothetical protein
MQDVLTWGALIAAGGSLVAIVTFWMNRGKAEADALAKADAASATAHAAVRYAASLDSLRTELRGMNERLDRIIERFTQQAR